MAFLAALTESDKMTVGQLNKPIANGRTLQIFHQLHGTFPTYSDRDAIYALCIHSGRRERASCVSAVRARAQSFSKIAAKHTAHAHTLSCTMESAAVAFRAHFHGAR